MSERIVCLKSRDVGCRVEQETMHQIDTRIVEAEHCKFMIISPATNRTGSSLKSTYHKCLLPLHWIGVKYCMS
jgi:hypothetical protein